MNSEKIEQIINFFRRGWLSDEMRQQVIDGERALKELLDENESLCNRVARAKRCLEETVKAKDFEYLSLEIVDEVRRSTELNGSMQSPTKRMPSYWKNSMSSGTK